MSPSISDGLIADHLAAARGVAALSDAVAPVSDRRDAFGRPARRDHCLGAAIRLLRARGRLRLRHPLRGFASAADRGAGAGLHDLSRDVLQVARRRIAHRLHGRSRTDRRRRAVAKNVCSTTALRGSSRRRSPTSSGPAAMPRICFGSAAHYKESRDCLVAAFVAISATSWSTATSGGLHVLWHLPPGIPDAVTVEAIALRARIGVYSLSSAAGVHVRGRRR